MTIDSVSIYHVPPASREASKFPAVSRVNELLAQGLNKQWS